MNWSLSPLDKQAANVSKLSNALGVPVDAAWGLLQGQQEPRTRERSASASCANPSTTYLPTSSIASGSRLPLQQPKTTFGFQTYNEAPLLPSNLLGLENSFADLQTGSSPRYIQPNMVNSLDTTMRQESASLDSRLQLRRHNSSSTTPMSFSRLHLPLASPIASVRSGGFRTPDGTQYAARVSSPLSDSTPNATTNRKSYF